jgi:hypothetical protein
MIVVRLPHTLPLEVGNDGNATLGLDAGDAAGRYDDWGGGRRLRSSVMIVPSMGIATGAVRIAEPRFDELFNLALEGAGALG